MYKKLYLPLDVLMSLFAIEYRIFSLAIRYWRPWQDSEMTTLHKKGEVHINEQNVTIIKPTYQ